MRGIYPVLRQAELVRAEVEPGLEVYLGDVQLVIISQYAQLVVQSEFHLVDGGHTIW